jgi:transcriptional regulator with XRE-family HTH domain
MSLNKNIVYLRERLGLTQRQAAGLISEHAGKLIKLSTYQAWETGENNPPHTILPPLCRALKHRSVHTLLTRDLSKRYVRPTFHTITK